jgi:hypothetical protein
MTFSIFDWLVISIRPKERSSEQLQPGSFAGLTPEEIRELRRMREEVRLAREQARLFVSQNRGGLL